MAEFTGRLQGVPASLEAVRQEMGIPQAFETFGQAGQLARGVSQTARDLPEAVQQALSGRGVSAGQITGRTASELKGLQPTIESAARGLESSQAGLENLLTEFSSKTQQVFTPFEIEAGMLGENIAQEFGLLKTNIQAELDRELAKLSRQTQLDLADIQKATRMAELEQATNEGSFADLGDRIALISPITGQEISSFSKGLTPARGTGGDNNLENLFNQYFKS